MQIVRNVDATFMGEDAVSLTNTTHHTVCRFKNARVHAFQLICDDLINLREELQKRNVGVPSEVQLSPPSAPSAIHSPEIRLCLIDLDGHGIPGIQMQACESANDSLDTLLQRSAPSLSGTQRGAALAASAKADGSRIPFFSHVSHAQVRGAAHQECQQSLLEPILALEDVKLPGVHQVKASIQMPPPTTIAAPNPDQDSSSTSSVSDETGSESSQDMPSIRLEPEPRNMPTQLERDQKRACDDAWSRSSVLTLDDGGVRGYVALLWLRKLMTTIKQIEASQTGPRGRRRWQTRSHTPGFSPLRPPSKKTSFSLAETQKPSRQPTMSSLNRVGILRRQSMAPPDPTKMDEDDYLPCHYFDFIGGSGTGGILAMMLGRLRMSVDSCLKDFSGIMFEAFAPRPLQLPRYRVREAHLGDSLTHVASFHSGDEELKRSELDRRLVSDDDLCKTVVIAAPYHPSTHKPAHIFRSYAHLDPMDESGTAEERDNVLLSPRVSRGGTTSPARFSRSARRPQDQPRNPGEASNLPLKEVARATTAQKRDVHVDEVLFRSDTTLKNPSQEVLREVLIRNQQKADSIDCVVTLGCGAPRGKKGLFYNPDVPVSSSPPLDPRKQAAYDCEKTNDRALDKMHSLGHPEHYYRFNCIAGSQAWQLPASALKVDMFEYRSHASSRFDKEIEKELQNPDTEKRLQECAEHLVHLRQLRELDQSRWERFTEATQYGCRKSRTKKVFRTRSSMSDHYDLYHTPWWRRKTADEQNEELDNARLDPENPGGP